MAGQGPAPKPAGRRARTNKDDKPQIVLGRFVPMCAPPLPDDIDWHPRTRNWWELWGASSQAETFTATDWSFLLDTALMHHAMWSKGQWTLAAEVRLRVAKFGATPEDRARLRMVYADADEKDSKRASRLAGSREKYAALRAVPPEATSTGA